LTKAEEAGHFWAIVASVAEVNTLKVPATTDVKDGEYFLQNFLILWRQHYAWAAGLRCRLIV
jgi:hypothetical protein